MQRLDDWDKARGGAPPEGLRYANGRSVRRHLLGRCFLQLMDEMWSQDLTLSLITYCMRFFIRIVGAEFKAQGFHCTAQPDGLPEAKPAGDCDES